jgi:queuine/archaeosine tRNA-ribosyltransferase
MDFQNDFIFFPAISIATHTQIMKADFKVKGKSPRFYLNNLPESAKLFSHPYILTSAAHNFKNMDFMKSIGITDTKKDVNLIFGDSGGFQIKTGVIKDTPEIKDKLYSWMENNVTMAPIIDHPPTYPDGRPITDAEFEPFLVKTKENIEVLLKRTTRNKISWLNVTQGRLLKHRKYWYDSVKDYNLDGWAMGSLRKDPKTLLEAFAVFLESGELEKTDRCKHIHFFGITATKYMPLMIYIKHKMNKAGYKINVSMDSSYATQNGGWGKFLFSHNDHELIDHKTEESYWDDKGNFLSSEKSKGFLSYHLSNRLVGKVNGNVNLPCYCPVCVGVKLGDILNENALKTVGESYYYNVVQSHNVFVLKEYVNSLQSIIYTDSKDLYKSAFRSYDNYLFQFIDKMFDNPKKATALIEKEGAKLADRDEDVIMEQADITDLWQ